jgi:hypothetical protein
VKQLPEAVRRIERKLFWDVDPAALHPEQHEDFIVGRVLSLGDLPAVAALRAELGDAALRAFVERAPHRLDRRSLRFFEVVLSTAEGRCTTSPCHQRSESLFRP